MPEAGDIFVVGCSTSEVAGHRIGSSSSMETAQALLKGILPPLEEAGLVLAVQCCEHLNRALVIEKEAARRHNCERVNAVPRQHAGGSLATAFFSHLEEGGHVPVLAEHVKAAAGLDIGQTLIGMHLRDVAVPVRLSAGSIGSAVITAARTRPRFTGGARAGYDESLL